MSKNLSLRKYDQLAEQLVRKIRKEVKPFTDDSPEDQERRVDRARKDLLFFCKTYLAHHFDQPWETGHRKINTHLKQWNKMLLVRGFRGLGKSTIISTGYALQANLFKFTEFIAYICDTDPQAAELALAVKVEMEENPRIRQDFGSLQGSKWEEAHFVTTKSVMNKCYSHRTFKRGARFLTTRPGIAICEDFDNLENVGNPKQVKKRRKFVTGELRPAMDRRKFQIIFVANRVARIDTGELLNQIESVLPLNIWAEYQNGNPVHPKTYPRSVLDAMKADMGTVDYNREMLGKIISSPDDDFQEDWIIWLRVPEPDYRYIVMALDPSVGSTSGHDHKAIVTIGLTADARHMDVLHSWIRKATIGSMCRNSFEINRMFDPHVFIVESNGFQTLIKDKMAELARTQHGGFDLMAKIRQVINKEAKNVRILRQQPQIENGVLRFVKGAGDNDVLVNQYLEFDSDTTDNEDDGPDATEMAVGGVQRLEGKQGTATVEAL